MKMQLLISSVSLGKVLDCSNLVEEVEITTNRTGSAGKMTFSILKGKGLSFHEGDAVQFIVDGQKIFAGFVFTKKKNRWGEIDTTCYDQLRYLLANQSYVFTGKTAGDIIKQIASDFGLQVGEIEDTGYVIPTLVKENKKCLDIISEAIQLTTKNTSKIFVFYDDFGKLCLKAANNLMGNTMIGVKSLLTEYEYTTDIDSETYNQIKLVRPNSETGKADTIIYKDSNNIERWGLLQLYEQVDEEVNDAQMKERAQMMLTYYNRKLRKLSIDSLGVLGVRAGSMIYVNVPDLGDISLSAFVLIDKVTHKFKQNLHEMSLDTRTLEV